MELRPAFDALFAIDDALADVVARSTQPTLGAIKLAWWRERLEELDQGKVPAEPRLQDAAKELLTRGIDGADLAQLEDGWATLLEEVPDEARIGGRGRSLFRIGAQLLGCDFEDEIIGAAGQLFAVVDVARRGLGEMSQASPGGPALPIPKGARPLTALAALAGRDLRRRGPALEPEATPGRAWTLLRHRLTGRIPR